MDKKNNLSTKINNLVFDLDGTLLNSQKEILPSSIKVLKRLQKEGKKLIFCTGRPWYFVVKYTKLIAPDLPIISCNGSLVYDWKNHKTIYSLAFEKATVYKIIDILIKNEIVFLIYTTKKMIAIGNLKNHINWFEYLKRENAKIEEDQYKFDIDFYDFQDFEKKYIQDDVVVKFLLIQADSKAENVTKATKLLEAEEDIYFVKSQDKVIDIMTQGSNKGKGLEFLAQEYGLDLEKTIVFGDASNDLPMFAVAKYSVAMGQAKPEIKSVANFTTQTNNDDGIAYFFDNEWFN
ncbi:Cof-type HAD-IIB family hydrolase [Mesomycoplasma conjunctivae]|uniref:Cof-type HAD-IIB family hydrolase n=1 Tax=Mesomycoplasma conjunctivae TaxID=45361 RepID=UPI003DA3D2F9